VGVSEQRGWEPDLRFVPMDAAAAQHIADNWHYPPPYDFYDMTADPDDYAEFLDPSRWPIHFVQALDGWDLIGFFSADVEGSVCEITLGMRPDLTSRGYGLAFLQAGLRRLAPLIPPGCRIILDVATFNVRAICVYRRAGFVTTIRFEQPTNGGVHEFVRMELADRESARATQPRSTNP
jgi:ribosomal-protein-alanine N-acetyltransferase